MIVAVLAIVVSGAAAGIAGATEIESGPPVEGGRFRPIVGADPGNLDPHAATPRTAPSGAVVDLLHQSAGMTMAADLQGALHAAALVMVEPSGTWSAVYARCTDECALATSWSAVGVAEAGVGHVPTIALTNDGKPRIAYYVSTGPSPGLHYAECDSDCLAASNWHDVWLADALSVNPAPRPRLPFAVSAAGGAASRSTTPRASSCCGVPRLAPPAQHGRGRRSEVRSSCPSRSPSDRTRTCNS